MQDFEEEAPVEYTRYIYKTTVLKVIERLDALGYSIENLEKIFNANIMQAIDYSAFLSHLGVDFDDHEDISQQRIREKVSFKKWKNAMNKIVSYELENGNIVWYDMNSEISTECEKVIFHSLKDCDAESYYAIYPEQIPEPYVFRLILESCENDDEIILDFSKLSSKFIAIFDNDTEGYQNKCTLLTEIKNWPDNFRILLYPENKMFDKYPTIAPNGTQMVDNINKKACSIELYLPDSIIEEGKYYSIEWEARKKFCGIDGKKEALY